MKRLFIAFAFAGLTVACAENKEAEEQTVNEDCIEVVNTECICTQDYNPVCGCNNKTYSNACAAECNGITDYKSGVCPE